MRGAVIAACDVERALRTGVMQRGSCLSAGEKGEGVRFFAHAPRFLIPTRCLKFRPIAVLQVRACAAGSGFELVGFGRRVVLDFEAVTEWWTRKYSSVL
jgi:hypothetical protein